MASMKDYQNSHTLVSHVHPRIKDLVLEHSRQEELSRSQIVEDALKNYYDSNPALVERLKSTMGKHQY